MVSDQRRRQIIARAKRILNDPGFAVRQAASRQATKKARRLIADLDAKEARQRRAVVAGVEVEREVGRLEVLTARLLRADAVRRTEMIDRIVKGNLSRWPSLQPSWKKR